MYFIMQNSRSLKEAFDQFYNQLEDLLYSPMLTGNRRQK